MIIDENTKIGQIETLDMLLETKCFKKFHDLQVTKQNWMSCPINTVASSGSMALEVKKCQRTPRRGQVSSNIKIMTVEKYSRRLM